jgi:formylglycine-generating enzyme required for sulfatase activity
MSGNVYEWTWDWYDASYYLTSPGSDPEGGDASSTMRVVRGGNWAYGASYARVADRDATPPAIDGISSIIGFRLARTDP